MISKAQAEIIADQLLAAAKHDKVAGNRVPRVWRGWGILVLPVIWLLMRRSALWSHCLYLPLGVAAVVGLTVGLYRWLTPQLKIRRGVMVCYGNLPWKKMHFRMVDIAKVQLQLSARFLRPSRALLLETVGGRHLISMSKLGPQEALRLRQLLRAHFKERYQEVDL